MTEKELEKHNFLTWCKYATIEEIEKAKGENNQALERLYNEYADEIEVISKTKCLYESFSQHNHSIGIQKFDLSLKISR
ncbi:MAG: hypothetical protein SCARUB_01449 [Candidatus Scalindua rubra]|uniref:Uncharacterized protein n=1 Tax=Candidatus Scalindua rubra TaxID=1872076 RepID=A0A1E3XCQ8_9BACT|nr:MAG: hypothetical protein SCARUB_01449 [Candidatus Scalindua rubra]